LKAPLVGERVAALAGELAVRDSLLAGFGQSDQVDVQTASVKQGMELAGAVGRWRSTSTRRWKENGFGHRTECNRPGIASVV